MGDSAYPNRYWIVTPFKDNGFLTEQQRLFNKKLSSKRVVIENAFGFLKSRFRRLNGFENLSLNLCSQLILASCVLHNIVIDDNVNDLPDLEEIDHNQPQNDDFLNLINNRQQEVFNEMFM